MKQKYVRLVWGICIIALGIILLGNLLGLFSITIFFDGWWTLFLIIPAIIGICSKGNKTMSLILLLVGVGLLAEQQNLITYDIFGQALLAAIVIIIGASVLISGVRRKKIPDMNEDEDFQTYVKGNEDKFYKFNAIFSGNKKVFNNTKFYGAQMNAIFGGVDLDLRLATIDKDAYIDATAVFGGIGILLPANVSCKVNGTNIFGGTDNKVNDRICAEHTVYINSTSIFGGVEIK